MNKTKIDWADYSINPVKGICPNNCWYCYARKMYKRFKWNPEIRLDLDCLMGYKIDKIKKPSRIFVGSMHDIFGNWIPDEWIWTIIGILSKYEYKKHTFIFLTKFPKRYQYFDFPENCWLGLTLTGEETAFKAQDDLHWIFRKPKNLKFVSYEPLLKHPYYPTKIDWVIIGGLTGYKYKRPDKVIKGMINYYKKIKNIPIFIKDNLKWEEKIQEFPVKMREA